MYYGNPTIANQENPTGVWDDNYAFVQHLNDDPTGTIYDSTTYQHQGTPADNIPRQS